MNNFSPGQWLCLGIAIVLFPGGIRVLKKSMAVKEMKSFDFVDVADLLACSSWRYFAQRSLSFPNGIP